MSLLVTGSIGIDTIETPHDRVDHVIGGSTTHFALAAALFGKVRMVGVVGEDFDGGLLDPLRERGVDTSGVEVRAGSKTFRWHGRYLESMNERETVSVDLNVLAERGPTIPDGFLDSRYVFLANTHPALQREFAGRLSGARLIVADTMDLWIDSERDALLGMLAAVHGVVINDGEARMLTGQADLRAAGRDVLKMGPRFVVIKKGEHGSMLVTGDDLFIMPAYPTADVIDPTGCGDSFAGAMMGYLAAADETGGPALRSAIARGSVAASFVVEGFAIRGLAGKTRDDVDRRLEELKRMTEFV